MLSVIAARTEVCVFLAATKCGQMRPKGAISYCRRSGSNHLQPKMCYQLLPYSGLCFGSNRLLHCVVFWQQLDVARAMYYQLMLCTVCSVRVVFWHQLDGMNWMWPKHQSNATVVRQQLDDAKTVCCVISVLPTPMSLVKTTNLDPHIIVIYISTRLVQH